MVDKSFENVADFRYLHATLIDQNCMHKEIKWRWYSRNVCYHSIQDLLSSHLVLKNIKTQIHMTISLPVLYAYETWSSLALRKNLGLGAKRCILAQLWWNNRGLEKIT